MSKKKTSPKRRKPVGGSTRRKYQGPKNGTSVGEAPMALVPIPSRRTIAAVAALTAVIVLLPFLWTNIFTIIVAVLWGGWQVARFLIILFGKGAQDHKENSEWLRTAEAKRLADEVRKFPKEGVKVRADKAQSIAVYATAATYMVYAGTAVLFGAVVGPIAGMISFG